MDSETLRQRAQRFQLATVEAFGVVATSYDLRLQQSGTGYLSFESPLVRMLIGNHRGEIDVGFAILSEGIVGPAENPWIPDVDLWLSDVLRFTAPNVVPSCPATEEDDLEGQMRRIAAQVDSFCSVVLRGDTESARAIRALRDEAAIAYTEQLKGR